MDDISLNDIQNYAAQFETDAYKSIADKYVHYLVKENQQLRDILSDRDQKIIELIKTKEEDILDGIKKALKNGKRIGHRKRYFASDKPRNWTIGEHAPTNTTDIGRDVESRGIDPSD